jgi:hypothetical protein
MTVRMRKTRKEGPGMRNEKGGVKEEWEVRTGGKKRRQGRLSED